MHASPLATRFSTRHSLRHLAAQRLAQLSHSLDRLATRLQLGPEPQAAAAELEYHHDPRTGVGVLYEGGERRFTFLQGLERL